MRRYAEIRIRLITDDASPKDIESAISDALLKSPILEIGELDIVIKFGGEVIVNGKNYAVPLPMLEDFTVPNPDLR
jgi:hypothetical protein